MLYKTKQRVQQSGISVPSINGGVNMRETEFNIDDNQCSDMNNLYFSRALKTRPALITGSQNAIVYNPKSDTNDYSVEYYDVKVSSFDEARRLCIKMIYTDSSVTLCPYLCNWDGSFTAISELEFTRTSYSSFYIPKVNAVFYNSKGANSKIFIMLTLFNSLSTQKQQRVKFYELSSDYTALYDVTDTVLYTPTVFINGKGNNYGAAQDLKLVDFKDTQYPEPFSRITGRFFAVFGSDGYSTAYNLPFKDLTANSGETVCITVRLSGTDYNFYIDYAASQSGIVSVLGANVYAQIDRANGSVAFFSEDGSQFTLPLYSTYGNNIKIAAYKTAEKNGEVFINSGAFKEYSSRIFISSGYTLFCSAQNNPFYFPLENSFSLGEGTNSITALSTQGKLLICFKSDSCFSVSSTAVDEYDINAVLENTDKMPKTLKNIRIDLLNDSIGCDCPKTLLSCANRLIWLNSSGAVYTIIASNQFSKGNIYELSLNIEPFLKTLSTDAKKRAVAVRHSGYYIVFIGNAAVAMDYTVKGFRYVASCSDQKSTARSIYWYLWSIPSALRVMSACSFNDSAILLCSMYKGNGCWMGSVLLSDTSFDMLPDFSDEFGLEKNEIAFFLKSKDFCFDNFLNRRRIKGASVFLSSENAVQISLCDNTLAHQKTVAAAQTPIKIKIPCANLKQASLNISGVGKSEIYGFEIWVNE